MIEQALIEAKKLLNFYIEEGVEGLDDRQIESVKHFLKALRCGCACDYSYGFECGCGERDFLCDEALKELQNLKMK